MMNDSPHDSPPAQRRQQDQNEEWSTTDRHDIDQDVYGNTRKHIPNTEYRKIRALTENTVVIFASPDDILMCANPRHELQQMLPEDS